MENNTGLTPSSVKPSKWSLHAAMWRYAYQGKTNRKPDRTSQMRGWKKHIHFFNQATIVINPKTMEVWVKHKKGESARIIYDAWSKADKTAREFSTFAQIAIQQQETDRPASVENVHVVLEDKALNSRLLPLLKPIEAQLTLSGMVAGDSSHKNKVEAKGVKSIEAVHGFDWMNLNAPAKLMLIEAALSGFKDYNENIKLHLKVLQEISDTLKELKKQ